jgi:hypothetical protein
MAPRALEQISQTVTTFLPFITYTPLSPSLYNPHTLSVVSPAFLLRSFGTDATSPVIACTYTLACTTPYTHHHSHSHLHSHPRSHTDGHTGTHNVRSPAIMHTCLVPACHVTDSHMRWRVQRSLPLLLYRLCRVTNGIWRCLCLDIFLFTSRHRYADTVIALCIASYILLSFSAYIPLFASRRRYWSCRSADVRSLLYHIVSRCIALYCIISHCITYALFNV